MDDFFGPENLLSPERLFGEIVRFRQTHLEASYGDAFQALDTIRQVDPIREHQNRKLFMSSVARKTDILGSVVDSQHDPLIANVTPIHQEPIEVVETDQAHIAYLRAVTGDLEEERDSEIPEDVRRIYTARQHLDEVFSRRAA